MKEFLVKNKNIGVITMEQHGAEEIIIKLEMAINKGKIEQEAFRLCVKDYLLLKRRHIMEKAISKLIDQEVFFPKIATLEKYYNEELKKMRTQKGNEVNKVKTDCLWCEGNGFLMFTNEKGHENCYRCDQCEAGSERFPDRVPKISDVMDVNAYNRKSRKEGVLPIAKIQEQIKGLLKEKKI
jgi:hypothetical protein